MLQFDHVIIGVKDLDAAMTAYREAGFSVMPGGEHATGTTQNALIVFEDVSYIELLAKTRKEPAPDSEGADYLRWFHDEEGYLGYAIYTDALDAVVTRIRLAGQPVADPVVGKRVRKDGVILCWRMVIIELGQAILMLIQDETARTDRIPAENNLHDNWAVGVKNILYVAADISTAVAYLNAITEQSPQDNMFHVGTSKITLSALTTDVLKAYHETHGDSVWRVVLDGIGARYKRFDAAALHGAELIIAGNV